MNDVRELLGRAAEDAGQPVISTEAVYARAARVRWRRRAAVSAAAVCAVAAGAFVVPGLTSGPEQSPQTSSVAAPGKLGGDSERARQLVKLLPAGVGSVEQVSLAVLIKHATPEQAEEHPLGPLDGQYAVRRDGGVGYLVFGVRDAKVLARKLGGGAKDWNLCKPGAGEPPRTDCVRESLPDGRVLTIWSDSMDYGDGATPQWGSELVARLSLGDGGELAMRDSTGFEADTAQGPLLKTPPLTRAQLRTLMLSPELLPKK
ncbi:hypothetical protein [Streptomyces sp. RKAG290]|uniref:hypothetical protein n=1 Tax=Streptomyces sp. RKAG290 TaxID=2888348 RepID=UPI00203491E7|nr:hypothetical protein [Streptomyces sp. RKAG290]MCM2411783.1 hypothetical protein [Streptomyces sp. RKAG290]